MCLWMGVVCVCVGGQHLVTCEYCNVYNITGEGTSLLNIVIHSFTSCVSSWRFYKDLRFVKHNL